MQYFHTVKFQWRNSWKTLLLIQRILYKHLFLSPKKCAFVCSYRYHTVLVSRASYCRLGVSGVEALEPKGTFSSFSGGNG